jgi:hypothetical protein
LDAIAYLFPVAAVLILADLFLTLTWSTWYFTTGPVVFRSIRFVAGAGPVPSAEALQGAATSFFLGRILFRDFGAYTFAFRRSLLAGSSLLNGLLEFNPQHHTVVAHARFAPFSVAFVGVWFGVALFTAAPDFIAMGLVVFAALFGIEYFYVQRALNVAVRVWAPPTA